MGAPDSFFWSELLLLHTRRVPDSFFWSELLLLHTRRVRVCVALQFRVSVAVLLELTELAQQVEMPCLCCNTRVALTEPAKPADMPCPRCHVSAVTHTCRVSCCKNTHAPHSVLFYCRSAPR